MIQQLIQFLFEQAELPVSSNNRAGHCRLANQRSKTSKLNFQPLEDRRLLAANLLFDSVTGTATIFGTATDDVVNVSVTPASEVEIAIQGGETRTFTQAELNEVRFWGNAGDDYFNNATSIDSFFGAHGGNDTFLGGTGNDRVFAGPGNDTLTGGDGDDYLDGGIDDDVIIGSAGMDEIHGGPGNDQIYGDDGDDYLAGEFGNDVIEGGAGSDYVLGSNGDDLLFGGDGDDFVYGQGDDDEVHGDDGNDRVRGNNGNDFLYGGDGDDFMMSDNGDDVAYGQGGADYVFAYDGFDMLDGGAGNDQIFGEAGTNDLRGGVGDDIIVGGTGEDLVHGEAGNDLIYGRNGNDRLFGGTGVDRILGGDGDDAIHGGQLGSADTLIGNAGYDRFLRQANDIVADRDTGDAVFEFENFSDQWEDLEIEVIDRGFDLLYHSTNNNALLVDTLSTDDLRFLKYDTLGGSAGINYLQTTTSWHWENGQQVFDYQYDREIRIADWDETSQWYNDQFQYVTVHEMGHNWDSELELSTVAAELSGLWSQFEAISGWTDVDPGAGYTQSHDGLWWYLDDAEFAENYGRSNPNEDLSTIWEYRFANPPANYDPALLPKLDIYTQIFDFLSG